MLTIQNNDIFWVIQDCINDCEWNIKQSFKSLLKRVLNAPSVIATIMHSIKIVIVFVPKELLDFFSNRKSLHHFILLICSKNITFGPVFTAYNDTKKLTWVRVKHFAAVWNEKVLDMTEFIVQNLINSNFRLQGYCQNLAKWVDCYSENSLLARNVA